MGLLVTISLPNPPIIRYLPNMNNDFRRFDGSSGVLVPGTQLIHEWVNALRAHGHDIADVSRGKPSFPAHGPALAAMQQSLAANAEGVITYGTHALGEASLKARAAACFSDIYGTTFKADHMAFTPGGQLGLYTTFKLLHQRTPGGVFISTTPGYLNYIELIELVTGNKAADAVLPIALQKDTQFRFTPEHLRAALSNNTRPIAGIILCNPLNPTGQVISAPEWQAFAAILKQCDAPIMLDEAFAEVIFTDDAHTSLLHAAPELQERTFLFRSGTKAFGMSGERLAVMALPAPYAEDFLFQQSRMLGNPPISGQAAMTAALESLDAQTGQQIRQYYQENAEFLIQELAKYLPPEHIIRPEGGFYLLARFDSLIGAPICAAARAHLPHAGEHIKTDVELAASLIFGHGMLENKGVAMIPASFFGADPSECFMRISFSVSRQELGSMCRNLTAMIA